MAVGGAKEETQRQWYEVARLPNTPGSALIKDSFPRRGLRAGAGQDWGERVGDDSASVTMTVSRVALGWRSQSSVCVGRHRRESARWTTAPGTMRRLCGVCLQTREEKIASKWLIYSLGVRKDTQGKAELCLLLSDSSLNCWYPVWFKDYRCATHWMVIQHYEMGS